MMGQIRVGVGGWSFAPWRGSFYPKGLRQKDELAFASRRLGAIEINATYRQRFSPGVFAAWARQTPEGFRFTLKGSMACSNRRRLGETGEAMAAFFDQGIEELGDRLGPILWQFMPAKSFDRDDVAAFLDLLPDRVRGRPVRHCLESRHASFHDPRFVDLCRARGAAICLVDHDTYPMIAETTADFTYARLMRGQDDNPKCYPPAALDAWARRLGALAAAEDQTPREVFAFLINGGKARAPAGAAALIARVGA